MTQYGQADVGLLLFDQYDLLGYITDVETDIEALTEEVDALGDNVIENGSVGVKRNSLMIDGFYNDAALGPDETFVGAQLGTAFVTSLGIEGNLSGKHVIGFAGPLESRYRRKLARSKFHRFHIDFSGSDVQEDYILLHAKAARTTTASMDGSSIDNGAAATNAGGAYYVHVPALTLDGLTSVDIKLRDSADNISFANVAGATHNAAAVGASRTTFAGTLRRYRSTGWTLNGTGGGSQTITFTAGVYAT